MLNNGQKTAPRKYDYCASCTFYLGAIITTLICQALAGIISAALAYKIPDISKSGDFNTAFMIVVQLINGAFIFYFTKRNNYKLNFVVFGDNKKNGKAFTAAMAVVPIVCAALLLIAMYLPTVWYGYFTQYALQLSPDIGNINITTPSATVMIVIASVFLAPVCEEFIYRGVLFNGLNGKKSPLKAVMLSALAFMLMHMSPVQVVFQFSLGVVGGYIVLKSKRLFPSMLMHATANALALIMELTAFGDVLNGYVIWLTQNIVAAVFITLGLFLGGGALLYLTVRFGFGSARRASKTEDGDVYPIDEIKLTPVKAEDADCDDPDAVRNRIMTESRDRDAMYRYFIGLGICAVMFIVNLVVGLI